jgi:DNA-binding FrmR family transcriptional regulator
MAVKKSSATKVDKILNEFPDHSEDLLRLRRIKGQIEGIERMVTDRRYCPDVMNQVQSVMSALGAVKNLMMERHLRHCVADALKANEPRVIEAKIKELMELVAR